MITTRSDEDFQELWSSPETVQLLVMPTNYEWSYVLYNKIVKRIISKLNGNVWAESQNIEGKGSRFCFTLPINND